MGGPGGGCGRSGPSSAGGTNHDITTRYQLYCAAMRAGVNDSFVLFPNGAFPRRSAHRRTAAPALIRPTVARALPDAPGRPVLRVPTPADPAALPARGLPRSAHRHLLPAPPLRG